MIRYMIYADGCLQGIYTDKVKRDEDLIKAKEFEKQFSSPGYIEGKEEDVTAEFLRNWYYLIKD